MRIASFGDNQHVDTKDMNNLGLFQREAHDALVAMGVGRGKGWDGFNVVKDSNTSVDVVMGVIAYNGALFGLPDLATTPVDLLAASPSNSKRIVTIVATGSAGPSAPEPRSFEVVNMDPDTGQETSTAISQQHYTENRRKVSVTHVPGDEAAVPTRPALLPNYVPIAYVTMQVGAGVISIEMATDFQVKSLQALEARLLAAEATLGIAGSQIETLSQTIANTRAAIANINTPLINQLARVTAEIQLAMGRDDDGLLFGFERFMTVDNSNEAAVGYKARVEEGLRFPWAASAEITPQLLNPSNSRVKAIGEWLLPQWQPKLRLDVWRQDISVSVADYNYSNVSATVFPGAKTRRRSGPSMIVSENERFWQDVEYTYNYLTGTFSVGDENWVVTGEWIQDGVVQRRVEQYFSDKIPYWNGYRSVTDAVSGNLLAQTFLNAQPGWLVQLGLRFAKVTENDLKAFITGVKNGLPSFDITYVQGLLEGEDAQASVAGDRVGVENKIDMQPLFMLPGQAYAAQLVTAGDFAVACRADNYLTNGMLFNGDGTAYVPDPGKDMNLRGYFALFDANYVEVEMQSLTLSGGMTDIDIKTTEYVPDGNELIAKIQVGGVWHALDKIAGTHPLSALPPTVPFKFVMVGTRDTMPGINLSESKVYLRRADDDFVWQSETKNCGTNASTITIELELVNWKPVGSGGKHALTTTVLTGGGLATSDTPDTTTDVTLPNGNVRRTMVFTPTPSATFAVKLVGTTTDIADGFVVRSMYYLASA